MIQYYTALGRYELRTNDRGEKHPVLISSRQEYAPDLCEMLLWSSLLWHIRDQKELEAEFARRKKDLHICDDYSLAYYCTRLERLGFLRRGSGYTAVDALFELMAPLYPVPAAAQRFPAGMYLVKPVPPTRTVTPGSLAVRSTPLQRSGRVIPPFRNFPAPVTR